MTDLTRREGLGMAALVGAGLAAGSARAEVPSFVTQIDFKDPRWNRDTFARLDMDLDPTKEKLGWLKGTVYGVRDNEPVRPLFINEGFSFVRSTRLPDGSWRRRLREVVFYRDLETGEILKEWKNPYTGRTVKVVPIANDPFNFTISEFQPEPPSYGGLNTVKPPRKPFLLDWSHGPNDTLIPVETIMSAAARTSASVTLSAKWFQLFHPIGGVIAAFSCPEACTAVSTTTQHNHPPHNKPPRRIEKPSIESVCNSATSIQPQFAAVNCLLSANDALSSQPRPKPRAKLDDGLG